MKSSRFLKKRKRGIVLLASFILNIGRHRARRAHAFVLLNTNVLVFAIQSRGGREVLFPPEKGERRKNKKSSKE